MLVKYLFLAVILKAFPLSEWRPALLVLLIEDENDLYYILNLFKTSSQIMAARCPWTQNVEFGFYPFCN